MNTLDIVDMRPDGKFQDGLKNLVDFISKNVSRQLTMIEIGSYQGESMEIFANTGKIKTIVCIDPWESGWDDNAIASKTNMEEVELKFDERVKNISKTISIIKHKGTIDTFIKSQDFRKFSKIKNFVDFVYVDACHTYDGCKHDLEICKKFINPKIAFAGHDYKEKWKGVQQAVDEILGTPDKVFSDSSWVKMIK